MRDCAGRGSGATVRHPPARQRSGDTVSNPALGDTLTLLAFLYLAVVSVLLTVIDLRSHRLPDRIVLPSYLVAGALLGLAALAAGEYSRLLVAGIGLVALWLFYFLLAVARPGGMGFGDVKLAGLLGLYLGWLGWGPLVVGALTAFLLGGIAATVLLLSRRASRTSGIPFGPWMLAGAWVGILAGDAVLRAYLGSFSLT